MGTVVYLDGDGEERTTTAADDAFTDSAHREPDETGTCLALDQGNFCLTLSGDKGGRL
jgi:hypothetical protein